jgi:hypothetical protein
MSVSGSMGANLAQPEAAIKRNQGRSYQRQKNFSA